MFKFINILIFILSSIYLSSCGEETIDTRSDYQLASQPTMLCDASIYGTDCMDMDKFVLVKKDELKPEHIKNGISIGGVVGSVEEGSGGYRECSSNHEIDCITTETYKSLDIEPYLGSILASTMIPGMKGRIENCSENEKRFSACYNADNSFKPVMKESLVSSDIKLGISLANISGTYGGNYSACVEDGDIDCVTTDKYRGINISNHKDKIISTSSILGVVGTFVLPQQSSILQTENYGINNNISGTLRYCNENDSGCYIKSYSAGVSGKELKAIDFDDLYSKRSYIKNGYTLVSGIVGAQSECVAGGTDCYINGDGLKTVEIEKLISSNIKYDISLGGVDGSYNGDYTPCSLEIHTGCIADSSYPSVPAGLTSSLLSSSSINGVVGEINNCDVGDSSCYINGWTRTAVETDKLLSSNIHHGISLGGVLGEYNGDLPTCSVDGSYNCIANSTYKAIDINNHRGKIISTKDIFGISGTYIVPSSNSILPEGSYGVDGDLVGTVPYCLGNDSGCYLRTYDQGEPGLGLQALDFDDLYSKRSNIKNGYELISDIVGTQSICLDSDSNCYINSNTLKAAELENLVSNNIKHDIILGGVTGSFSGNYTPCSLETHTGCITDSSYPSVPAGLTSSLLSSSSINGVVGEINDCDVGDSSCYINGSTLTATESNKLLASNIHHGISLGGVLGEYNGDLPTCSVDGSYNCIANSTYKAIDINNHRGKIISSKNIFGVNGTYIIPSSNSILPEGSYGVDGDLVGTVPYCSGNDSGCYLRTYDQGELGLGLQALDFDDLYSKRSNIKNGYELISDIVGTQSICSISNSNCYINTNTLKAAETSQLLATNIKHDLSIGGVVGSYNGEYSACSEDESSECIATSTYKAININNHKNKIISTSSIADVTGSFVIPAAGLILPSASYGPGSLLSGTAPYCSSNGSGCYIKTYSEGEPGLGLKALDFDDLYSKRSYIKNGYSLVYGVEGTQSLCSAGDYNCYIDSSFKAVETSRVVASNIRHDLSLAGVSGSYNGDHEFCSAETHTSCVASSSFPSVPATFTDYLLSTAEINGVDGEIEVCDVSDSSCYISSNSLKAVESSKLISSNIKHDVSLGGVTGIYTGPYFPCSGSLHTSCIADLSYPSVPAGLTSSLLSSESINGTPGDIDVCSAGDSTCYIGASFKAAESSLLLASNIKLGVSLGGINGGYPSFMYPLSTASFITDLTSSNFDDLIVLDDRFEWFDSYGNRHQGQGSSNLIANNIKDGTDIFGVVGSYLYEEEEEEEEEVDDHQVAISRYGFAKVNSDGTVSYEGFDYILDLTNADAIFANDYAFAALKKDGTVVSWGNSNYGGNSSSVQANLVNVVNIFSNRYAFAALKSNGSVVTWGNSSYGGNSSSVSASLSSGVVNIFSNNNAFAALKSNGSVVTWGNVSNGGNSSSVAAQLTSGVTNIFSNSSSFAALKSDGSLVVWGNISYGGNPSSSNGNIVAANGTLTDVTGVFPGNTAYAILKSDKTVVTWGDKRYGGDPTYSSGSSTTAATSPLTNVINVFPNSNAFAALKSDGSVVTWGSSAGGGNSSSVAAQLTSGVVNIFTTTSSYVALKSDGSVVTWGNSSTGGNSSSVAAQLTSGVTNIFHNQYAVVALKSDGSVVTWGNSSYGGDSSSVAAQLTSGVVNIFSNNNAFAALKSNGSVVTWGYSSSGGDSSSVATSLSSGVVNIFSNTNAFVALKSDGSVVTWGSSDNGGDTSSANCSVADVVDIKSTGSAFAALKDDDTVAIWGNPLYGGYDWVSYASISSSLVDVEKVFSNNEAFTALKEDGSVITWGKVESGGNSNSVVSQLTNVKNIYFPSMGYSRWGFAALKNDGTVVAWGKGVGADTSGVQAQLTNVKNIFANAGQAVAAVKEDGSVVTWGDSYSGGDSSSVQAQLTNVKKIFYTFYYAGGAFAALQEDGTVVTWGSEYYGGDSSSVSSQLTGVVDIVANSSAFAARKSDGTVVAWGDSYNGGDSSSVSSQLTGVTKVVGTKGDYNGAFAVLKSDGTTVAWGDEWSGGDSSSVQSELTDVVDIYSSNSAFAALKEDGTVVTWGNSSTGGDSSSVQSELTDVASIYSNGSVFVAVKSDGTAVSWGDSYNGGDSSSVMYDLTDITDVFYNGYAFAALKSDNTVVSWGYSSNGGDQIYVLDSSGANPSISDIVKIYSSETFFVGIRSDGTYISWGTYVTN